jgi:Ca2+-transporting ATPase
MPESDVVQHQSTSKTAGLTEAEAAERLKRHGRNAFPEAEKRTWLALFLDQFKDLLVLILVAAAVISLIVGVLNPEEGGVTDAIVIFAILILNAAIGISQELKADKALEALKKMSVPLCEVIRGGKMYDLSSEEIVPGDVVVLREGDFVPADLRLIEAPNLRIDEASLTGESVPVEKVVSTAETDAPLAERVNMAYAGTHVVYGRGRGIVIATGMQREVGRIAAMLQQHTPEETPLQRNLAGLGKMLAIGALVICGLVFVIGLVQDYRLHGAITQKTLLEMFMTSVSLAVAAIPEGLPAIVTIVLAMGVYRMSRFNAIVRKLPAVETLGCATYICTDKTGTLTQNRMTIMQAAVTEQLLGARDAKAEAALQDMMRVSVLCNDAHIQRADGKEERFGDPTELAFIDFAEKQGWNVHDVREKNTRLHEVPFDSQRKMMSTLNVVGGHRRMLVKGAPNAILDACTHRMAGDERWPLSEGDKRRIHEAVEAMSNEALRVLAFAWKPMPDAEKIALKDERELVFAGIMGMMDPPRPEVRDAVREAREAGIQVIMITGDNGLTAKAVAADIGMLLPGDEVVTGQQLEKMSDDELRARINHIRVFARVWPEQKMRIVQALQARGEVVAMTGDGVNDAPAIKKSDIGVAMGITGTEVAKETSDMVLTDDNFATIVHAIKEGRVIFDNIRKFIMYLLACNVGEIFAVFIPILLGWGAPFRPVQILLINLVTDGAPALSLGAGPAEPDIMKRKPRAAKSGMISGLDIVFVLYNAFFITVAVILSYKIGLEMGETHGRGREVAMTMAFVTLAIDELWRAYCFRSWRRNFWQIGILENKYLVVATVASAAIVVTTVCVEPVANLLGNEALNGREWAVALSLSLIPFVGVECWTFVRRQMEKGK